jgi:hypothetical protein
MGLMGLMELRFGTGIDKLIQPIKLSFRSATNLSPRFTDCLAVG